MTMKLMKAGDDAGVADNMFVDQGGAADGFLRIGDMAKKFGVTLRTLRFYEDKGLLHPQRDGSTRLYTRRDKARLKLILLGRKVGFSLRDVKQMMDLYDPSGTNTKQLRLALDKSEKQLARLQKQKQVIEDAIDELSNSMSLVRKMLAERSSQTNSAA
ncbi:MerR family DNA-binding transcriptional regulator [Mesorhizobium sp. AaZ16]|jgi:DNA-binding transcriptional MerR regulator|uniref:MerR family transcriptional regulator n=1 Tax=Mesorhizobium sp. AaZ16 TaxID=3402289 RepID=UPI002DF730F2|nr:MerR family DNA-binding transcriptional regulator [Pseudaminobacter sp.]